MNECVRILQVVSTMNRGGIENMLMNLYRRIDREKIQFDFVVHHNEKCDFEDEILSLGGRVYKAPQYRILNDGQYKKWWNNFFKAHYGEYLIVHSHSYTFASIHLRIAKKYGLTTVVHSHSSASPRGIKGLVHKWFQRNIADIPDYLFACSKQAGEWLYGFGCEKRENFFVLNNAIDTEKYTFNEEIGEKIRQEFGIENKFVVGHVGRFSEPKNHSYLIDVFKNISEKKEDAVLLLVGSGELKEEIAHKAKQLGIDNKVIFAGIRADVNEVLQAMDCFVFPSHYEGLPVAVIEAQAAGLRCFISDKITTEVCLTNLVQRLTIDANPILWSEEILKDEEFYKKINTQQQIIDAGYDVATTVRWIEQFYLKNLGKLGNNYDESL